jgi:hypothetical protein
MSATLNLIQNLSSLARILARCHIGIGRDDVEQMMRDARTVCGARLRGTDFELPIHRDRIAVDDLSLKPFREVEGKRRFATGGRSQDRDQQRITLQRRLQCRAYQ